MCFITEYFVSIFKVLGRHLHISLSLIAKWFFWLKNCESISIKSRCIRKIKPKFYSKVHLLIRRNQGWKSREHRVEKTNLHLLKNGIPRMSLRVYWVRWFRVKDYNNNSSSILAVKVPKTTLACYDVYSCGTFDHLSFIYRMHVKITERRNGSPVIYFQIRWGFLSVHNAFKVIRESQRPS